MTAGAVTPQSGPGNWTTCRECPEPCASREVTPCFGSMCAQLVVRASMGSMSAWNELVPAFTRLTGHQVVVNQAAATLEPGSDLRSDLIALYGDPMQSAIRQGRVVAGSITNFARAAVGLSVRSGASWPDISTPEALRRTL